MALKSVLKTYFQTGVEPTSGQFNDLIDTMFSKQEDKLDTTNIDGLADALANKADIAALNTFMQNVTGMANSSFRAIAAPATDPGSVPSGSVWYFAQTAGTYANFKDNTNTAIAVSSGDVAGGLVILTITANVATKTLIPLNLTAYYNKTDSDGRFAASDTFNSLLTVTASSTTDTDNIGSITTTRYSTTDYTTARAWFFAKSNKHIDYIKYPIFRDSAVDASAITNGARLQVLVNRPSTNANTILLDKTIDAATLQQYIRSGISGINWANFYYKTNLDTSFDLVTGDIIEVLFYAADKFHPCYSTLTPLDATKEWNDGSYCYRNWTSSQSYGTLTVLHADSLGSSNQQSNYTSLFFGAHVAVPAQSTRLNTIESNVTAANSNVTALGTSVTTNKAAVDTALQMGPVPVDSIYSLTTNRYNSGSYATQRIWYFPKGNAHIAYIKVPLFKDSSADATGITNSVRIQVLLNRSTTNTVLLDKTIAAADMQQYIRNGIANINWANYYYTSDLTTAANIQSGDIIEVMIYAADKLHPLYCTTNALDVTKAWNDNTRCFYYWNNTNYGSLTSLHGDSLSSTHYQANYQSVVFGDYQQQPVRLNLVETRIAALESGSAVGGNIATITELPTQVYGLTYNASTLNFLTRMYAEGVFRIADKSAALNGSRSAVIDAYNATDGIDSVNVVLSCKGYNEATATILYNHNNISRTRNQGIIKLQAIGDSLTDGQQGGIGYPSCVDFLMKSFNADLGNISYLGVGTVLNSTTQTQFGKTFTVRGCDEGRSGWAVSDLLRHVMTTRARFGDGTSANQFSGKVAWDSLGLGTMTRGGVPGRSYLTFAYSDTTGNLVRNTPHGYYDADPSAELWAWIKTVRGVTTFTWNSTVYTLGSSYTTADDAAQKAYIRYLCDNAPNPFFDYQTVQDSNGAYAFNYTVYQNRYKTLNDDGVTRLVVGSTAGSRVTDATLYDVCKPTHVSLIMSYNDINNVADGTLVAADYILLASRIKAFDNGIKIAMGTTRLYGVFDPGKYTDVGFVNQRTSVDPYNLGAYTAVRDIIATNYPATYSWLPIYAIQTTLGIYGGTAYDTFDAGQKPRFNGDGLHAGTVWGYLDRAIQVIAWIASTY